MTSREKNSVSEKPSKFIQGKQWTKKSPYKINKLNGENKFNKTYKDKRCQKNIIAIIKW